MTPTKLAAWSIVHLQSKQHLQGSSDSVMKVSEITHLLTCAAQLGTAASTVAAFHSAEPLAALVFVVVTVVIVFKVFLTSAVYNLNPQASHEFTNSVDICR